MFETEFKLCPDCGRLLKFWKGQYLCSNCWKVVDNGLPKSKEGLCRFVKKEAELCIYLQCRDCSKIVSFTLSEWKEIEDEYNKIFNPQYIEEKFKERQTLLESIRKDCELKEFQYKLRTAKGDVEFSFK